MEVTFRIRRFNPEVPGKNKPYWEEFTLQNVDSTDRVLELLHRIKWEQDGTLTLRRSCAHGVCGSDAMRINGRNMLACKAQAKDFGGGDRIKIQVEPILGLPVLFLSPVLALTSGMIFVIKAGILTGEFYFQAAALFATAIAMAVLQHHGQTPLAVALFGVVSAACFFVPGWKYYRQSRR